MKLLEQYIACMEQGNESALADLFADDGVFHDSSLIKIGQDTLHLEGKMAVEMMFHYKFGFNNGPFTISGVRHRNDDTMWYFVEYNQKILPVTAFLIATEDGQKIKRLNVYPL